MPRSHSPMASIGNPNPKNQISATKCSKGTPTADYREIYMKVSPRRVYMGTELIKSIAHQQISNNTIRNVTKFKHRFSINFTKLEKKKKKNSSTPSPISKFWHIIC